MEAKTGQEAQPAVIRTPDYRLRVFVSSTLRELAEEREAVRRAILKLHLAPVMFESGARPHPAQDLYRAYLSQSHVFVGIYWQSYGWVAPGSEISGLEDEYNRSANIPALIYIKDPAPNREPALTGLLERIRDENASCFKYFSTPEELGGFVENDLVLLLAEFFETARREELAPGELAQAALTNVPIPRNPLIGREQELAAACHLIRRDDVALVTLTGPAGVGKSRLGIEIALALRDHFEDGVYMVGLESITDPDLVIPTIAITLGVAEAAGEPSWADLLHRHLCDRQVLLLLDNFEQVLPAAPRIAELLEACPEVKILVTSRALLHLRAEKALPVPPLAVPPLSEAPGQPLSQYSAVQLFIQRAQGVRPDFQVTNENAPAVAEICHRLDGLPLAIELAAARTRMLSPQELLRRLERRFELLRGGTRDLPERQHTLYSAIDWSYNLLKEDEKCLFRQLSVFAGGWTFEAAEAVSIVDGAQQLETLDGLEVLMGNSLLKPAEEVGGELRFAMLETIREYASKQLALSRDEEEKAHCRHAHYYLALAEQAARQSRGGRQSEWLDRLEREHGNLRAALERSIETMELESALRLGAALWRFWAACGCISEGRRWLDAAWTRLRSIDASSVPITVRAAAFSATGALARIQGDLSEAKRNHRSALDLHRKIGDKHGIGNALNSLAIVSMFEGRYTDAQHLLEESLDLAREENDETGIVHALNNLGVTEMYLLHFDRALQLHEKALAIYRKRKDRHGIAASLGNIGDVLRYQGDYLRAESVLQESLELMREADDQQGIAITLSSLGRVALVKNDAEQCKEYYTESLMLLRNVGDRPAIADALEGLAAASCLQAPGESGATDRARLWRAAKLCAAAEGLREKSGAPMPSTDLSAYERTLSAIRAQLDAATLDRAWDEGRTMTLEQAIDFAIRYQGPESQETEQRRVLRSTQRTV